MTPSRLATSIVVIGLYMLFTASCTAIGATETASTQNEVSQDEYDVYNAVLEAHFVHPSFELLVIDDHTGIDIVGEGGDRAGVRPGSYNFHDKYPKSRGLILF